MSERWKRYRANLKRLLFTKQRGSCAYCSVPHPFHDLTFDHVVPKKDGGKASKHNLVLACWICNQVRAGNGTIETLTKAYRAVLIETGRIP
jgi:5-methylcytosine-specific restriction endonuclease McrA